MAAIVFPPTPAPSTDITGKENTSVTQVDASFVLPPSALASRSRSPSFQDDSSADPDFVAPLSPPRTSIARSSSKRNVGTQQVPKGDDQKRLPPPPMRARKIIQMKPKTPSKETDHTSSSTGNQAEHAASGKKKQGPSGSAGRKIARKTAHSVIERRRREKMNEEFSVLKNMVPACEGQEMHKLAILQASIEYMQYLQRCVNDLTPGGTREDTFSQPSRRDADFAIEVDSEVEMKDAEELSTSTSPTIGFQSRVTPTSMASSSSVVARADYGDYYVASSLPSPAFEPQYVHQPTNVSQYPPLPASHFSPVIHPQARQGELTAIDHEASTALLMLNADDRRSTLTSHTSNPSSSDARRRFSVRGMSVRDLLRS